MEIHPDIDQLIKAVEELHISQSKNAFKEAEEIEIPTRFVCVHSDDLYSVNIADSVTGKRIDIGINSYKDVRMALKVFVD